MQNQGNEGVEKKKRIVFSKEDHLRVTRIYVEVENQFGNISENRKATHVSLLYKQQYSQNRSESTIKKTSTSGKIRRHLFPTLTALDLLLFVKKIVSPFFMHCLTT